MMEIEGVIRTRHNDPAAVAGALSPDNLAAMETRATAGEVVTVIQGTRIRSLIASVDDYLTNLSVAEEVCRSLARNRGVSPGGRADRDQCEESLDSDESA